MFHRNKWTALGLSLFTFLACDPIDSGELPTFQGSVQTKVMSQQQVALSWDPGSDDLVDSDELRYGIWYAKPSDGLQLEQSPQILTQAGAIAYNLIGLEPETKYEVLVRTRDLGLQFSANTTTSNFTTHAEGAGRLTPPLDIPLNYQPTALLRGYIFSERRQDIGLVDTTRIRWHASQSNGVNPNETANTNVGTEILEAYLVSTSSLFISDLFVVTAGQLSFYRNNGNGFNQLTWSINQAPQAGTLEFYLRQGLLVAFSFLQSGTTGRIYSNDTAAEDVNDTFVDRGTVNIPNNNSRFILANIDDDSFVDMVSFGSSGLRLSLGSDETYKFDNATDIDGSFRRISDLHTLLINDGDQDNDRDIYIYERNLSQAVSQLHIYQNKGDGSFENAAMTDYQGATYVVARFSDIDGDGDLDLTFLQSAGNNVAVLLSPSDSFDQVTDYFGAASEILGAVWGSFDDNSGQDMAFISSNNLTVLRALSSSTSQPF